MNDDFLALRDAITRRKIDKRGVAKRTSGSSHFEDVERACKLTSHQILAAQRVVCGTSTDSQEATELLSMLGILPGNVEISNDFNDESEISA